jgi:ABC-type dipeptide/oligopeptide/nickel transport system ATPase component
MSEPLLSVQLQASYPALGKVLEDLNLELYRGEILGLMGESGSGKSTLGYCLNGLLPWRGGEAQGEVRFDGQNLLQASEAELRRIRGRRIATVFQDPHGSLNPALTLRRHFEECWRAHRSLREIPWPELRDMLQSVGLPGEDDFLALRPPQLSIGMAQRAAIALSLLHRPDVLIADEVTSALDLITAAEVRALLQRVNTSFGVSILFISHDLPSVSALCHRVAILKSGRIIETAPAKQLFTAPQHPYTRRLLQALPQVPAVDAVASR